MKVAHIQSHLPSSGNAAYRLHKAFLQKGIESIMLSRSADKMGEEYIYELGFIKQIIARIYQKIASKILKVNENYGLFSYPFFGNNISKMEILKDVDYIYLHWINGNFLSLKNIKQLALLNKPIIIFMHDMWTITGGCHYSFDCEKYKSKCNSCQMFTKPDKNDLSAKLFEKKLKLYNAFSNLYFVSPSKWLYNCAKKSTLTKDKPIFHIPNIIDPTIYKPFNKEVAREILNIEKDSTVLCFGASSVKSPYKGWDYLVGALKKLKAELQDRKIEVLIFGHGNYKEFKNSIPYKVNFIGPLRDDYSTLLLYNASDLFIIPSLADNLPTTVMESLCCGTPVVGFNTGGIPDMIEHKKNGYLCEYKNIDDIIKGIIFCLNNSTIGYNLPEFEEKSLIKRHLEMLQYIKNKN